MSEFYAGQRVECIAPDPHILTKGKIYTVQSLLDRDWSGDLGLMVTDFPQEGFKRFRFRPLESKAISIFRKIALDVTEGRKVRIRA